MANYNYIGREKSGKEVKGSIVARSITEAKRSLRAQGIAVKKINLPSIFEMDLNEVLVSKGLGKPFGNRELTLMTKQLGVMISAGVPILQAFDILHGAERNPMLKKIIKEVSIDIGGGKTVSEALAKHRGFSKFFVNMIKAGESGGVLDEVLLKLTEHMERQEEISRKIKSAMTYPAIVTAVGLAVVIGMMYFIVPMFQDMLTSNGQKLPMITQFVIDVSDFIQSYILHIIIGLVGGVFLLKKFIQSPTGKPIFDKILMRSPVFGMINIKGNLAFMCRTLSTMLNSGVSLIDSLDICIDILNNQIMIKDMQLVKKSVVQGKTLSEPVIKIKYFPEMVAQMIKVGEQTGKLDSMLEKVADVFEDELNFLIDNMTKLIEPIIIVVLGGFVAIILLAMYMPIFSSAAGV